MKYSGMRHAAIHPGANDIPVQEHAADQNAPPSIRRITGPYLLSKDQVFWSCLPVGWS